MSQIQLADKSVVELKAIAYDLSEVINNYNQMIQLVNNEIAKRKEEDAVSARNKAIGEAEEKAFAEKKSS